MLEGGIDSLDDSTFIAAVDPKAKVRLPLLELFRVKQWALGYDYRRL